MRARAYCAHPSVRDHWALKCISRCPDQVEGVLMFLEPTRATYRRLRTYLGKEQLSRRGRRIKRLDRDLSSYVFQMLRGFGMSVIRAGPLFLSDTGATDGGPRNCEPVQMTRTTPESPPPLLFKFPYHANWRTLSLYGFNVHQSSLHGGPLMTLGSNSCYTRAFGDGPRHFEPWSSDEDDT
ncbi:hypothetical protein TNCV_3008251 [Trichonephila clavipes]|nr:hypothetical protein TNCV_3008251 [Trichonephila clavipes]